MTVDTPTTTAADACTACQTPRLAAFRYCLRCGHDFEGTATEPAEPIVVPPPPPGIFVTGASPAPDGLAGRRTEAVRPWRDRR